LSIDPDYARAQAMLADTFTTSAVNPVDNDYMDNAVLNSAHQLARKAMQLDPNLPQAHASLGRVLSRKGQHDEAITAFERAVALNPNLTDWRFALCLMLAGQPMQAIQVAETNIRLDPFHNVSAQLVMGVGLYILKRYSDALIALRESV